VRYLYGVVRAGHPEPNCPGVGSPPGDVRLVESGPLAAAVTDLADDFELDENDARAHLDVLVRLLSGGPVLPLRLGTVAPDDDAIRAEVLDAARAELVERLDALVDLVELHVDADDDETETIAAIARTTQLSVGPATDLSAKLELGREVAELIVEQRRQLADQIVGELRPFALGDLPRSMIRGPEDPMLRWAFLVRRDDVADFDQAVIAVRSHHPKTAIRYVGPLPPAHFIDWQQDSDPQVAQPDSFSASSSWGF
jgi:hypothetical protein